uniref:Zn(2)-C6 fungal-type domain-containing protein n=1 Tax=Bionectria ochroleuca TaxID=29856 RepID=A0A8H7K7I1_BIOOC
MIEPRRASNISICNIQSNFTRMDGNSSGPSRLTCDNCRERKVKCNRQYPECSRCSRLGYQCTYRNRMSHRASQAAIISRLEERVRDAEARLALQSAGSSDEGLIHVSTSHSSHSHSQPTISPSSTSNSHGAAPTYLPEKGLGIDHPHRSTIPDFDLDSLDSTSYNAIFDQIQITDMEVEDQINEWQTYIDPLPIPSSQAQLTSSTSLTSQDLSYLHQVFFDSYFTVIPILAKDRFYRELRLYPDSVAVKSVAYSVALLAITISDSHKHLEGACYTKTRRYIDDCDIEEVAGPSSSINLLQSLLFLTRYEVSKQKCARSYLTLARASHLVKMMRLDQMDKGEFACNHQHCTVHLTPGDTRRHKARRKKALFLGLVSPRRLQRCAYRPPSHAR